MNDVRLEALTAGELSEHPDAELLPYSLYEELTYKPSKVLPNRNVIDQTYFRCPGCHQRHSELEHGGRLDCDCGLHFALFGNGLFILRASA